MGYSLADDLLSGMGLAIGYSVLMSVPVVGAQLAYLVWGGPFPGSDKFLPRLEILHVLVVPVLLAVLISVHLAVIARQHHSQFPGPGRTQRNVVGTPMWPAYALRSLGLLCAVVAVLVLLGGLIQINPVWEWGPYQTYLSTSGAQPDWYLGWLIGALRLMVGFEPHVAGYTLVPNPFWGGVLFPTLVFAALFAWPALERRITGDHRRHELLDRPRDNPWRTAMGMGFLTWVWVPFFAGSTDRIFLQLGISYTGQIWFFRIFAWVAPFIVYKVTRRICEELRDREIHPLRSWQGRLVRRTAAGGFEVLATAPDGRPREPRDPDEEPAIW
jgi:ubiquinol-cytochrome c reductase cytochrome b subunit